MSIYEPGPGAGQSLRIMLLCSAFNGLTQRVWLDLREQGHHVTVQLALGEAIIREAADAFTPDLILCPFLKERVPQDVYGRYKTIIIHPGRTGDRGPSSLDWTILQGDEEWGVTALEASEVMDGGDIWHTALYERDTTMRKGVLYNNASADAALACVQAVVAHFPAYQAGTWHPTPLDEQDPSVLGRERPSMPRQARAVDLTADSAEQALLKILASDGVPGAPVRFTNVPGTYRAYDAHLENAGPRLAPGEVGAWRDDAVLVGTASGNLWIGHLKAPGSVKLPATQVLGEYLSREQEWPLAPQDEPDGLTYQPVTYRRSGRVGTLAWTLYNGAMSTAQLRRLQAAVAHAAADDTDVLVVLGGPDAFSNGIHLNVIEASATPAREAWENINAINDVIFDLLNMPEKLIITAFGGNAGAGGVILGLAGDIVLARAGTVFNPHYRSMGLYGSEFWTRLLPSRVGPGRARELTDACLPVSAQMARRIGLVDEVLPRSWSEFLAHVQGWAEHFARLEQLAAQLALKAERRAQLDAVKPLAAHRAEELAQMSGNMFGDDSGFALARRHFVHKVKPTRTPGNVAIHRLAPEDADLGVAAD